MRFVPEPELRYAGLMSKVKVVAAAPLAYLYMRPRRKPRSRHAALAAGRPRRGKKAASKPIAGKKEQS